MRSLGKLSKLRFYVGCHNFQKKSTSFLTWSILIYMIQAVSKNGLIDMPGLFMILTLASISILRKTFPVFYGFFSLGMMYYFSIIILTKIMFDTAMDISFI
jgi:hypothetical protein